MKKKTVGAISRLAVSIILLVSASAMGQTVGQYELVRSTIDVGGGRGKGRAMRSINNFLKGYEDER